MNNVSTYDEMIQWLDEQLELQAELTKMAVDINWQGVSDDNYAEYLADQNKDAFTLGDIS